MSELTQVSSPKKWEKTGCGKAGMGGCWDVERQGWVEDKMRSGRTGVTPEIGKVGMWRGGDGDSNRGVREED